MRPWVQIWTSGQNQKFRDKFVRKSIESLPRFDGKTFLDIGAGNMPYGTAVTDAGFRYLSHDFGQYSGDTNSPGQQAGVGNWITSGHEITCTAKNGATELITVPFSSRMRQAPFWFSSGLSPYCFMHHAPTFRLEVTEIVLVGDFVDAMIQRIGALFGKIGLGRFIRSVLIIASPLPRAICTKSLLESGALRMYISLKK